MRVIDSDTGREFFLFESEEFKEDSRKLWENICSHINHDVGRVTYSNGSIHVRQVCFDCGEFIGDTIKKSDAHNSLPIIDQEKIRKAYQERRQNEYADIKQKHVRMQRKRDAGFQKEYVNYLSSPKWKERRERVLQRANYLCEGCLENRATTVHHLNYRHIYHEMLFDLVALCHACHAMCHPDKNEMSDEEFYGGDLPCFSCRWHGEAAEGSWCNKFNVHTVISLTDLEKCGPKARELEPLK